MRIDINSIIVGLKDYGIVIDGIPMMVEYILQAELDRMIERNDEIKVRDIVLTYNEAIKTCDYIRNAKDQYLNNRINALV